MKCGKYDTKNQNTNRYNEIMFITTKYQLLTIFKVRLKYLNLIIILFVFSLLPNVFCNRPPRFLIDGQTEIVLRLKEGAETPVGSIIYRLKGFDPDGDKLTFGVRSQPGSDVIRVESVSATEANVYLNKELDRETRDEYPLVLTLTDSNLTPNTFVTQSLLILVEDINDNIPTFLPYNSTIKLREDSPKNIIITTLEAVDYDEGAYGQVVYKLERDNENEKLFSVGSAGGKAVVRLIGQLDYERRIMHQIRVLAVDRAKIGRINTATAQLIIQVQDVEDRPPEFVQVQPVARIAEDVPAGSTVLQVTAVDGDRGINNQILYVLSPTQGSEKFKVNETTGVVKTTTFLDREDLSTNSGAYILKITALEQNSDIIPTPSAITEVTVIVTDINDETPTFRSDFYECEIAENAQVNTPVAVLNGAIPEVYDYDQGKNGTFRLYLSPSTTIFEITPSEALNEATFLLRVKNPALLDYESITQTNFTIVAEEIVDFSPRKSQVNVVVNIRDVNDNVPEFTKNIYETSVFENCEVGATIAWVQALDEDSEDFGTRGVRYTNLAGGIQDLLHLHPITGIITVKTSGVPSWDRELFSRHHLTVEARDDLGFGNRNTVQLVINILDINDNAPIFTQSKYEARLKENDLNFEIPLKVKATDADVNGTINSQITYEIISNSFERNFTLNSKTGLLVPSNPLDFESLHLPKSPPAIYPLHLKIRARDSGFPPLTTFAQVTIFLEDMNDHSPQFLKSFYTATIPETATGLTEVVEVKARDFDATFPNNKITYMLEFIDIFSEGKFIIGAESGIVYVAKGALLDLDLDASFQGKVSMRIIAQDGAVNQRTASTIVNITILDVNNKSPIFSDPGKVHLKENSMVGTKIIQLQATDPDTTAQLRYKIAAEHCEARTSRGALLNYSENDFLSLFHINSSTGIITIGQMLDRETVEVFKIAIIVEDVAAETGIQIDSAILEIIIDDINDNNPRFLEPFYRFSVTENSKIGVHIGWVGAEDPDENNHIRYSLEGPKELTEMLNLNSETGEIVVAGKIDHEQFLWINLTLRATDTGIPPRSTTCDLFILVQDENDNNPVFLPEPRVLQVFEDAAVGLRLGKVEARDADGGDFGKVTYLLDRISSQGLFGLEPETGILRVSGKLDREERSTFLLVVEAWDNYQFGFSNGESRNAFKQINVTILDANDNPPQILLPFGCVTITEFHDERIPITFIQVTDLDDPDTNNGKVVLDIVSGNEFDLFGLEQTDEFTYEFFAINSLKGRHGNHSLLIRARDLGTPQFVTESVLNVCITDFNDHVPVFLSPKQNTTLRVPENATIGSSLIQITATDADVGQNGAVRFRLKPDPSGHWRAFNLQPVSGILELRQPLNRSRQKIYDIRIEAYDLGNPTSLSSDLDLTIYVSNINDYQPQFLVSEIYLNFTENQMPEMESHILPKTIDRDEFEIEGPSPPICYYIVSGDDNNNFYLNRTSHELTVTKELDREFRANYEIYIKASEDCNTVPKVNKFDDDTLLKVKISVTDVNDNAPKFIRSIFTGGVTTGASFGSEFMSVKAIDLDEGENAIISYYLLDPIQMTLTEGFDNLKRSPFLVDIESGGIRLNFDPLQGMKGYFDFLVLANDTYGLQDTARVFIYLLREDQRVRFILRQQPPELRHRIESFREILGNVTGAVVNVDEFRVHVNRDGSIDKTKTDLYLHLVDRRDHSVLEVSEVLRLVDQNTEKLDALFKEFNVLDTQPGSPYALEITSASNTTFWLTAASLFLTMLLLLCLALCVSQRQTYQRKLKAATTTAYGSDLVGRGLSGLSGRVPNTNKHSVEGSNPIWLQAYENEWYKHADDFSQGSEIDSLNDNIVSSGQSGDGSQCHATDADFNQEENYCNRVQNVYQTLNSLHRKLETTEL